MEEQQKPKRTLTEAQLRALAEGRKKSLETRKKKGEISRTIKKEAKEKLEKVYDEVVAKKAKKKIQEEPIEVVDEPSDEEGEEEVSSAPPKQTKVRKAKSEDNINYKQLYYKTKLEERLHQREQQQQQLYSRQAYAQAPPAIHAYDIAKENLAKKANHEVLQYAFKQIFPSG